MTDMGGVRGDGGGWGKAHTALLGRVAAWASRVQDANSPFPCSGAHASESTTMDARKLTAIMAVDMVGYSRLMNEDESGTARAVRMDRDAFAPIIQQSSGRIVKLMGDGMLLEFASIVGAVDCAIEIQKLINERNDGVEVDKRIVYRIGLHVGDVLIEDGDIIGEGVNIAARLEKLCEPGGILISGSAYEHVRDRVRATFTALGQRSLKNIPDAISVFGVSPMAAGDEKRRRRPELPPRVSLSDRPSIAVLAFRNASGDQDKDYIAEGIAEELLTILSNRRDFIVIGRNSAFSYKNKEIDVRDIGQELGVRYVLEGSVRLHGDTLRISAKMTEAESRALIWADRFDGNMSSIFQLQDDVTSAIARAIEPSLQSAEFARAKMKPTDDLNAYDCYLQALFILGDIDQTKYANAVVLLKRAIELDSNFSDAIALLANITALSALHGWIMLDRSHEALSLARQAVRLDRQNPAVLAISACCEAVCGGSHERAEALAYEALRIAPNGTHVRVNCGVVFMYAGNSEEAIRHYEAAIRLSPLDPYLFRAQYGLAAAHFFAKRFEESVVWGRRAVAEYPSTSIARRYLCAALALGGRTEEAAIEVSNLLIIAPDSCLARSLGATYRHKWQLDLYVEGLRLAGLPEHPSTPAS